MEIRTFEIPGVKLLIPRRFADAREFFCETGMSGFRESVADVGFVQDNTSLRRGGTVRGLHFQKPPFAQGKLVQVLRGAILDVAVDIRSGSPTFGCHVATRLDAPQVTNYGYPLGFSIVCTLEENTQVAYKVTQYYSAGMTPELCGTIRI